MNKIQDISWISCSIRPFLVLVTLVVAQEVGLSSPMKAKNATMRLLWLGSSSTYYHDTPRDVANWITQAENGLMARSELIGRSGTAVYKYLESDFHFEYGLKQGQSVLDKIQAEKYDIVILQIPTDFLAGRGDNDREAFLAGLRAYVQIIRESGSRCIFYEQGWS